MPRDIALVEKAQAEAQLFLPAQADQEIAVFPFSLFSLAK